MLFDAYHAEEQEAALVAEGLDPVGMVWIVARDDESHCAVRALRNLIPVTLGNIVGGAGLVGGMYWFIYLRPGARDKE